MSDTTQQAVPFTPKTEGDRLAMEIATTFGDEPSIPKYARLCATYDLDIIKRVFFEVQRIPQEKIRKSKAALLIYLVKKYAKR